MTPEEILRHAPRLLSQAQREFFFANGYLLVERAVDATWLSRLREVFATLEKKGEESDSPADFETLPDGKSRRPRQAGAGKSVRRFENGGVQGLRGDQAARARSAIPPPPERQRSSNAAFSDCAAPTVRAFTCP